MGGRKKNGLWRGEESPTDHSRQGGFGRGMRIATGAERPRNDRRRKNLRVIPRPVRKLVVGSEPSAASGRGSEVSEWPRSKFPASAVRQRRNFGHRNRVIGPYGEDARLSGGVRAPRPTEGLQEVPACGRTGASGPTDDKEICASPVRADVCIGPYGGLRGMCGLGIGPCGSFLTGREWYVSDFGGGG